MSIDAEVFYPFFKLKKDKTFVLKNIVMKIMHNKRFFTALNCALLL